jgi:hypothetical protein
MIGIAFVVAACATAEAPGTPPAIGPGTSGPAESASGAASVVPAGVIPEDTSVHRRSPTASATASVPGPSRTPTVAVFEGKPVLASPTPYPTGPVPDFTPAALPTLALEWREERSPDGRWIARSTVSADTMVTDTKGTSEDWYYRALHVASADGTRDFAYVDEWSMFGMGYPSPAVMAWAPDSSAVYLYETGVGDGCDIWGWGGRLERLDLRTGVRTAVRDAFMNAPMLSPDMRTLVFGDGGAVVTHDLASGREQSTGPAEVVYGLSGFVQVGGWVWSPSGDRAAFSFTSDPCETMGVGVLDRTSGRAAIVVPQAPGEAAVVRWDGEGALVVRADPYAFTYLEGSPTPPPVERRVDVPDLAAPPAGP